jgi:hypothetical protein
VFDTSAVLVKLFGAVEFDPDDDDEDDEDDAGADEELWPPPPQALNAKTLAPTVSQASMERVLLMLYLFNLGRGASRLPVP